MVTALLSYSLALVASVLAVAVVTGLILAGRAIGMRRRAKSAARLSTPETPPASDDTPQAPYETAPSAPDHVIHAESADPPQPQLDSTTAQAPTAVVKDANGSAESASEASVFLPRIFISHSSADNEFGYRLTAALRKLYGDEAVWYDSAGGLVGGDRWVSQIAQEIHERNTVILILSPEALASDWVRDEVELAWKERKVIIPLLRSLCEVPTYLAYLDLIQRISFLPQRSFDEAFEELQIAISTGKSQRIRWGAGLLPSGLRRIKPSGTPRTPLLIGREKEVAQIEKVVRNGETAGVCALNGMGGIGKTALAARVAWRLYEDRESFPGGVAWVECDGLIGDDGLTRLWNSVARSVQLDLADFEKDPDARLQTLVRSLGDRPLTLLVLDNIESNLNVRTVVDHLAIPGSTTLLLTSRRQIEAEIDQQIILAPLDVTDGARLLEERMELARMILKRQEQNSGAPEAQHIRDLAAELGGLPLAIELTAAYMVRQWISVEEMVREVRTSRLDADPLADPQRGLRACFERSWRALDHKLQLLFAGLSLFTGATLPEAGAIELATAAIAASRQSPEVAGDDPPNEADFAHPAAEGAGDVNPDPSARQPDPLDRQIAWQSMLMSMLVMTQVEPLQLGTHVGGGTMPEEVRQRLEHEGGSGGRGANARNFALHGIANDPRAGRALNELIGVSLLERVSRGRLRLHPFLRDYSQEQLHAFNDRDQARLSKTVLRYWLEFINENSDEFGNLALQAELDGLTGALEWARAYDLGDIAQTLESVLTQLRTGKLRVRRHANTYARYKG